MDKHYSIESVIEMMGDDKDFLKVVAQTFLTEIPPDLSSMSEAIEHDNKELAYQFAHKMKPNLEMFGLNLSKDIGAIESWTRGSKSNEVVLPNLNSIKATLQAVFIELKADFKL